MRAARLLLLLVLMAGCGPGKALLSACGVRDVYRREATNQVMTGLMFSHLFEALAQYEEKCGGYPATLEPLERPDQGNANTCARSGAFEAAILAEGQYPKGDQLGMFEFSVGRLASLRTTGVYREYGFRYVPHTLMPTGLYRGYVITADPLERNVTGFSSFWMSERGEMRENDRGPAEATSTRERTFSRRRPTKR